MDFQSEGNISSKDQDGVELDEEFLQELETEDVEFTRADGLNHQNISLCYVINSMEVLNERLGKPKYDPNTDIVKNEYEGGFTVWECTYDLINFLLNNGEKLDLNSKSILDIGCGHGLVGIFCLKAYDNCSIVFQDYNLDVLKFATVPNLVKNGFENRIESCKFISGDWGNLEEKVSNGMNEIVTLLHREESSINNKKFNAIFMSEVLYNPDNYDKLAKIINNLLEKDGVCVISSKVYYFGAGGSVDEFKEFLEQQYPHLKTETLQEIDDKKSNKREIFAVHAPN